jgi:hypothetical protein
MYALFYVHNDSAKDEGTSLVKPEDGFDITQQATLFYIASIVFSAF